MPSCWGLLSGVYLTIAYIFYTVYTYTILHIYIYTYIYICKSTVLNHPVHVISLLVLETTQGAGKVVPVAYASSGAVLGPSSDYASGAPLPAERDYHRRGDGQPIPTAK